MAWRSGHLACAFVAIALVLSTVTCNRPPSFVHNIDLATVKENTPIGSLVHQLKATDPENSRLTYGLEGTKILAVDSRTGLVTVAQPIDREVLGDNVRFFVTVEDLVGGGHDNNLVRVPVTLLIIDENDNAPKFSVKDKKLLINVSEDTLAGSSIIDRIEVTDPDLVGSVLRVTCERCNELFKVVTSDDGREITTNLATFSVILNSSAEYSTTNNKYNFDLVATDGFNNSTLPVEVTVVDVQNKPPVFVGSMSAIIAENAAIGTLVSKIKAIDGDVMSTGALHRSEEFTGNELGRQVVYELFSSPADWFTLDRRTGELRVSNRLDKEAFPSTNGVVSLKIKAIELDSVSGKPVEDDPMSSMVKTLTITLQDVNDEAPKAQKHDYSVTVPEGVPNGTPLTSLDMIIEDKDSGSNAVFNVALTDPSGVFSVEPNIATGSTAVSIRVANGPLDYENPNQRKFILLVVATEAFTSEKLSSTSTVTVIVTDVNDNKPEFLQDIYTASVLEDAMPGTIVTTIRATDRDSHAITAIEYSLFGNGAELFQVSPSTGAITVSPCPTPGTGNCIDFETRQSYFLSFQANDGHGQSSVVPLQVHITDANDNVPVFVRNSYSTVVDEGSIKFEPALRVKATDADVTSVISYSIVEGNNDSLFAIDSRSGEIKVNAPVRSTSEHVVLKVQASDGGKGIASTKVTITIRDANDNSPIFERNVYTASVSESALPRSFVEQLQANDADSGLNAAIDYRIQRGAFDEFFIDPSTGTVQLSPHGHSTLDYDRRSLYEIEIIAVDQGIPARTGTATLVVKVINHNDKSPYFEPSTQRTQVNENVELGTRFFRVNAKDPDVRSPESLAFKVENVQAIDKHGQRVLDTNPLMIVIQAFFDIESTSGLLFVGNPINREFAAVVTLNVSVTDISSSSVLPQTAYGTVIVNIIDHNDHPPIFGQPWSPDRPELSVSTLEEQPIGTVLLNLLATDQDSKISHYEISPENQYFEIGRESGVVSIKKVIDYETIVRDSRLELDPRIPKYPNQIRFSVVAYDSGVPQLSATAIIHVNVLNINDNEPIFNQTAYSAAVKENTPPGAFVAQVKASDADFGKFGKISYSIISVSGNGGQDEALARSYFTISNETGVVRVAPGAKIDREKGHKKLTLQIAATDDAEDDASSSNQNSPNQPLVQFQRGTESRMISVPLYITIDDVNDNAPKFSQKEYEATTLGHADGSSKKVPVIQISASDADGGVNGQVAFIIKAGNVNGIFEIEPENGLISAIRSPLEVNAETGEYKLTVEARDESGSGPYTDQAIVRVKVIHVNRHKPKFLFPSQPSVEFFENQKPGSKVLRVQAYDEDSGHNGIVRCSFKVNGSVNVQETDEFKIDPDSGQIVSKIVLDRELRSSYDLVLVAQDFLGEPQSFETLQQLQVIIKDVDDNKPEFTRRSNSETYIFEIYENEPRGAMIGRVQAIDKDIEVENTKIYYHIIDGNQDNLFHMDKEQGVLFANVSFDREVRQSYGLVVKASPKESLSYYVRNSGDATFSQSQISVRDRSYNPDDFSLTYVQVRIKDMNDNKPVYAKPVWRAGVATKADIGSTVVVIKAEDNDAGLNSSLTYTISATDLYRKGYDLPDSPVRPIPSPFSYRDDGSIVAQQLVSQYPTGSRFVLYLEAKEKAPPHRMAQAKLNIYVYESSKLIRITVKLRPEMVNQRRNEIEQVLSDATELRAIIIDIKFHFDPRKGRLVRDWSDIDILVVDDRTFGDVHPQRVISKLDSNALLHRDKPMLIDHISLASSSEFSKSDEELDLTSVVFIVLCSLIAIGFVSMGVSCCCLGSWYQQKLLGKARKAAAKAKAMAMKEREAAISIRDSTLRLSQVRLNDTNEANANKSTLTKANADKRQQAPRSSIDNPLWTESALKYYEEQELSIQVSPGDLMPSDRSPDGTSATEHGYSDNASAHYATVLESSRTKSRQRQPDIDNHEYHELTETDDGPTTVSNGSHDLATNAKGEPELVTHLL